MIFALGCSIFFLLVGYVIGKNVGQNVGWREGWLDADRICRAIYGKGK